MAVGHDRGGTPGGPVDRTEHQVEDWEVLADAINQALRVKGLMSVDELRRAIEQLGPELYELLGYYERWVAGFEILLAEKNLLSTEEIDRKAAEIEKRW